MHQPFRIISKLEIEKNGNCFLNAKRIELLKRINSRGSILGASKDLKMSYQQAWVIIKELNSISPLPVVTRQRGGTNGGGAVITNFGFKLIESFERMVSEQNKYISEMEDDILACFI